jgi:hypothetical protein
VIWRRHKHRAAAQAEADQALKEAVDLLHEAVVDRIEDSATRGPEARRLGARLRKIQRENHFGPSIAHVYGGRES